MSCRAVCNEKKSTDSGKTMGDRSEFVFFDVETTVPTRSGQGFAILEFGAILVCPKKLVELESYSTLVRPSDLSLIDSLSVRCNGITRDAVVSAPTFSDVADKVYDLLQGRIWAGHNILRFDCARIREAFSSIGRPVPEPRGTIDSLALLTQKFGRRAGDMKMATLATYFGLGQQVHRSLDDVRMNLEVLKYCATVLFLESSLPDIFTENSWVSPNATTRSRSNGKGSPEGKKPNMNSLPQSYDLGSCATLSPTNQRFEESNISSSSTTSSIGERILNLSEATTGHLNVFDMTTLSNGITEESLQPDVAMEGTPLEPTEFSSGVPVTEESRSVFLEPDEVLIPLLSASFVPFYRGSQRIKVLHKDVILQLFCARLRLRFGLSTKFFDQAGRPRLSFVVDAPQSLCHILDACDDIAQRLSVDSGSSSEWRPSVMRKDGFLNYPTVRLCIPAAVKGDNVKYGTEIYRKDSSGAIQELVFSQFDAAELGTHFVPKTHVDAYISLDPYDYQQNAGIRLVAKKIIINSN